MALGRLDRDRWSACTVATEQALGRVTAAPVFARTSSPTCHSAAMDGIAVTARATFAAREGQPLTLAKGVDYDPVNTGHPLPPERDAVIMIEHVRELDDGHVAIEAPAFPWQHVRRIGEDIVATELLLPQNHELSAYDLGALLSGGIFEVPVHERLRLTFIPTGDEVLDFTARPTPGPGQVIESNSVLCCALAEQHGIDARRVPPVADDPEALFAAAQAALDAGDHIVVLGAGSSAGSRDYTSDIMARLGEVLVHGIAAMPGKPTLIGIARNGALLVGAPGYPVSAVVAMERVLIPIADWLSRRIPRSRETVTATLTRSSPSKLGQREYLRLAVGRVGSDYVATPLARGAGLITTLTKAQGVTAIGEEREGLEAGAKVPVELLTPPRELERTLVVVGSHDMTLDLLANELMGLADPVRLASTHVGSMGGITALKSGAAQAAGAHLFDPETADFNFPFLAKYAPELQLLVVNLAIRHQGLIVAPGNPKAIRGVADLARDGVTFINRQRGAGTRILLDYHLQTAGLTPAQVRGYDKEETTHMAVAVNVLTHTADCGLGVYGAAKALGLDFVPLARERYDLLIPLAYQDDPKVAALLALLRDPAFHAKIMEQGGYETTLTGQVMRPGMGLGE